MKKFKKIITTVLLFLILILLVNQNVFANSSNLFQKAEYSEDFKKWLELSEEEQKKVMMPRIYEIENTSIPSKNPLFIAKMLKASMNSKYNLRDVIPENIVIRNQQQTNSCWTFAALSSLETNLALSDYKKGINLLKIYDFSERHMEYATSKFFKNNVENKIGYNRQVGSGGNFPFAISYLTNGSGAIPESEMPFENNENLIDISQIQNKTVSSQVYDTVDFADYSIQTDEKKVEIMSQIKQHIQNYGAVYASMHGNSSSTSAFSCYNNDTGAKFCNSTIMHRLDHAVSLIGWDDNYSIDKFSETSRPTSNGAWIVRNSWGEEYGDNGLIYVSYEDCNISKTLFGIVKATDTVDYDNIYQYDEYYPGNNNISVKDSKVMLCNIFNKKTTGTEYLTQVALYAPETYTCKVYVNPNGTSKAKNDLQLVPLKVGESETFNAGYHTLEFLKPIEIKSNSFAVVIEVQGTRATRLDIQLESKIDGIEAFNSVTVENGKCFVAQGNDLSNCEWIDLGKLSELNSSFVNGDSTIKAFTTTELLDDSLKNIEITTPPTKTSYFEGENFDKTGMVVRANYNSNTKPSVILDGSSYSITNGTNLKAGQTSVTITYEDKSVNQPITVEKNGVVELKIKTPPTKTAYKEGESFDKTGMVIEATYKDGTTKVISDYKIENGNNLKTNQTQVTISYGEKTIEQPITVTPNLLTEIKVTKAPNKTNYVVGQNFDKTGMVVTGTYQDGTRQEILDYTIENGTNLSKEQTSVTIKYEGKTTLQTITVQEKAIIGISISKKPSKIQYIQNREELDLTGGTLKVDFNDNSSEEIALTSDQVKVTGFDNKKLGKNTITITYQTQTTTLDIEIVAEVVAKNSNFDKPHCNINSAKYYTFTNKNTQEYVIMDITINGIVRNIENDSYEYYYYLSSNPNENNIQDWVKISENQTFNDKLTFKINTKDVRNYEEISDSSILYLYIKEVVVKGGNQSVLVSNSIELGSTVTVETYLDNIKVNNSSNSGSSENSNQNNDNTTAGGKLPQTGSKSAIVFSVIILIVLASCICYVRYNKFKEDMK